jgi:PAS domain S-box-containing protein
MLGLESSPTKGNVMQTNDTAEYGPELQLKLLSEVSDAVIVTDRDEHVLYWNGRAEKLYGFSAEQVLGRQLDRCCPCLGLHTRSGDLSRPSLAETGRWTGEILYRTQTGAEICLESTVSVLQGDGRGPVGFLWIQRDVSDRKRLESALTKSRELLRKALLTEATLPERSGSGAVVLLGEDDDNEAWLMCRAWRKAGIPNRVVRVCDGQEVIQYLEGEGPYHDRERYPLPCLLLLDLKMPRRTGLEVLEWLRQQPELASLPAVVLTASSASQDIRAANQLGVKAYLVKRTDFDEWTIQVQMLASECREFLGAS